MNRYNVEVFQILWICLPSLEWIVPLGFTGRVYFGLTLVKASASHMLYTYNLGRRNQESLCDFITSVEVTMPVYAI